ncbi:hypothetical protein [Bradyrhizobium ottawaense]|uniref:hypothetical protein n=1 Tax=Bradyrhizobium ottawaense TaxID=931866 RepID=UPI001BAB7DA0|nr:hypothetical protein [Bradyrhizobium ottawaense]MBR1290160.1 hypothetical protein [Bradyrhizobium ottawaense]
MSRRMRSRSARSLSSFKLATEAVACNFLALYLLAEGAALAVPRSHNLIWAGGRYKNPVYGQHFLDVIDILCAAGFAAHLSKGFRVSAKIKSDTAIISTDRLADALSFSRFGIGAIWRVEEPEVLVLKDKKAADGDAALIDYRETSTTRRLRAQVRRLNRWLASGGITLAREDTGLEIGGAGELIAPFKLSARRIFNNGSWQQGGRLAGPFFLTMEKAARFQLMRIDSERIAVADYGQLFPRLAYARAQCTQTEDDLYDISLDGSCRRGWKTLLSALLFAQGQLGNWPDDTRQHFPAGTKLKDAIARIHERHHKIAHLFGIGLGYSLMKIESDLIIAVTSHLFRIGVTACPIHDAIICARSKVDVVRQAMQQQFEKLTGSARAIVEVDFGDKYQQLGSQSLSFHRST